jgi:hypothetical protein
MSWGPALAFAFGALGVIQAFRVRAGKDKTFYTLHQTGAHRGCATESSFFFRRASPSWPVPASPRNPGRTHPSNRVDVQATRVHEAAVAARRGERAVNRGRTLCRARSPRTWRVPTRVSAPSRLRRPLGGDRACVRVLDPVRLVAERSRWDRRGHFDTRGHDSSEMTTESTVARGGSGQG